MKKNRPNPTIQIPYHPVKLPLLARHDLISKGNTKRISIGGWSGTLEKHKIEENIGRIFSIFCFHVHRKRLVSLVFFFFAFFFILFFFNFFLPIPWLKKKLEPNFICQTVIDLITRGAFYTSEHIWYYSSWDRELWALVFFWSALQRRRREQISDGGQSDPPKDKNLSIDPVQLFRVGIFHREFDCKMRCPYSFWSIVMRKLISASSRQESKLRFKQLSMLQMRSISILLVKWQQQ